MESGRIAAVGSADGSTTIVQFSDGLVDIQPNEKQALTSVSPLLQPIFFLACHSPLRAICAALLYCTAALLSHLRTAQSVCSSQLARWTSSPMSSKH